MTPSASAATGSPRHTASLSTMLALALPALGVLVAEPIYLLVDLAVVGRLSVTDLAALAVGTVVLAQVSTQLTFMSYGTTARAAREFGAGNRRGAVAEGIQATWLALVVGLVITVVARLLLGPLTRLLAGSSEIADTAAQWLSISLWGVPLILVTMAGNGWLRGVQNTVLPLWIVVAGVAVSTLLCPALVYGWWVLPELGLTGSAWANVAGQVVAAMGFVAALARELRREPGLRARPALPIMGKQLVLGRDLIIRSLSFQACFVAATALASRTGSASVAAHQIAMQLWSTAALILDALAIAAQALVGAALGARALGGLPLLIRRTCAYSVAAAGVLALALAAGHVWIPELFTNAPAVVAELGKPWWFLVALLPLAGLVFALDGVLLGAGDAAFLRTASLVSALGGFLPVVIAAWVWGWGLRGIWSGLVLFIVIRAVCVVGRTWWGRWIDLEETAVTLRAATNADRGVRL